MDNLVEEVIDKLKDYGKTPEDVEFITLYPCWPSGFLCEWEDFAENYGKQLSSGGDIIIEGKGWELLRINPPVQNWIFRKKDD